MMKFDPVYRAYYDDIGGKWFRGTPFSSRFYELNTKENLTPLEEKELIILVEGTEEEYQKFLKENPRN